LNRTHRRTTVRLPLDGSHRASAVQGHFRSPIWVKLADAHCTSISEELAERMPDKVDLYDNAYANYGSEVYQQVRIETYGQDLGQTSWVTMAESREIPHLLGLTQDSSVLEIGCGSGRYALDLAKTTGCRLVGLDVNAPGVQNANALAAAMGLQTRVRFEQCDASKNLPFEDGSFDAVFANDVLCHLAGRSRVLHEIFRVLKQGGRILFSDALVIGGMISHEEIATRSSIGFYVYSPPGENERLIERAGFQHIHATDTTANASQIAEKWHDAREKRRAELIAIEGKSDFDGVQRFLNCVHNLTTERRLLRYLYLAEKSA
jgi:SAM-dependent methyltransferase